MSPRSAPSAMVSSLSPGVLLNLLQDADASPPRTENNSAAPFLLQVTAIVPAMSGATDLFPSHGFYLKVSDASHSVYTSLPPEHADLILADCLQLGQLILIRRLDHSHPFPVLRGVHLLPGPYPQLTEAAATTLLLSENTEHFPSSPLPVKCPPKPKVASRQRTRSISTSPLKRTAKRWDLERRSSEVVANMSKMSVTCVDEDSDDSDGSRVSRISSSSFSSLSSSSRALRQMPLRRSWDAPAKIMERKRSGKSLARSRSASVSPNKYAQRLPTKDDNSGDFVVKKRETEGASKAVGCCNKKKVSSAAAASGLSCDIRWPENSVSWASLPSTLVRQGKEVVRQRDTALHAALDALQEASASEELMKCLSVYSELKTNKSIDPQDLIPQFLKFQHELEIIRLLTHSLAKVNQPRTFAHYSAASSSSKAAANLVLERRKAVASWIKAAVETNLSQPCNPAVSISKETSSPMAYEKPPSPTFGCRRPTCPCFTSQYRKKAEAGPFAAADLATLLQYECNRWFLNYIEILLDVVHGDDIGNLLGVLKRVDDWLESISSRDRAWPGDGSRDCGFSDGEETEACARVRRKIYGILLRHVESAAASALETTSVADEEK